MNQPPDAKYVDRSLVSFQPSLPEVTSTDFRTTIGVHFDRNSCC